MFKVSRKVSLTLSMTIAVVFFGVCIYGMVILPGLVEMFVDLPGNIGNRAAVTAGERLFILIMAYGILVIIMAAVIMMLALLRRVYCGKVFTPASVALIRGVSWCCFLLCLVFGVLGKYFLLAYVVALAAVFLGLCLRVVKNVIEEATEIKMENDLTV